MQETERVIALISEVREKANRFILDELKRNHIDGLAPSHGAVMIQLYKHGDLCMKDLAEKVGKDKSTITALVNKLVKLGYIEKVKDREDNRMTHLILTDKGRSIKGVFSQISEGLLEKVYRDFEEQDKVSLIEKLERVSANL